MTTEGTIYLESSDGLTRFDFSDVFTSESNWSTGVARELNARTVSANIQPLTPHESMTETFACFAQETDENGNDIVGQWENLLELKEIARKYRDTPDYQKHVWLYVKRRGTLYRAYIYMIDIVVPARGTTPLNDNGVWHFVVTMLRHPYWETPEINTLTIAPGTGVWYGKGSYNGAGHVNGRVNQLRVDGTYFGSQHGGYYIGFKEGDTGSIVWYWDCEDANTLGTDASVQTLSGSRTGNAVRVTFSTSDTLTERIAISLADAAADQGVSTGLKNNRGQYLLLLRYYATGATSSYSIRPRYSGLFEDNGITGTLQYVDGEATPIHRLLPLGVVSLPWSIGKSDLSRYDSDDFFGTLSIYLDVERYAGSGNMYLESLFFVPYQAHLHAGDIGLTLGSESQVQVLPDDGIEGIGISGYGTLDSFDSALTVTQRNWGVPNKPGYYIVVLDDEGAAGSPSYMELSADINYYRRHLYI